MLNRIIRFSLLNRMIVLVLTALIIVAGCIVLTRAEVDIFPDLNAPTVVVMTEAPGLAPEEVEKQVTYPVETAMTGSNGVRRTRSSSSTGFSVVWIEFDWGTDIYRARQTVAERLATIIESLPAGVGTPVMGPQSSILGEVMIIGFTPDSTSILDVRNVIDRQVRRQLLATPGVAQVSVLGGEEREMQVLLSPEKMKFHNVTLAEVLEALDGSNDNATGSILYAHGNEYIVKGAVNSATPADIANLSIPNPNGKLIR
jgi:Cu(I)/Ag(I) efflux system membrane protein CusA/SilA